MQSVFLVNLSKRGVFTIPKVLRKKLGLKTGMKLNAYPKGDGIMFEIPTKTT